MSHPRGHALGIFAVALALGCRADASATDEDSKQEVAADTAAAEPTEPAEDPRLVDLENRKFPLLVWSAHVVDQEYFDKARLEPKEQLLSAVTFLGLHTPEFFAELDGDALVVKVRARTERFEIGDIETLDAAVDRLEEILDFTQSVLDLEEEPL